MKSTTGIREVINHLGNQQNNIQQPFIISARVIDIILDNQHLEFDSLNGWNSIGVIKFRPVSVPFSENNPSLLNYAKPFFPNIKHYPLKNEIVFILSLPSSDSQNNNLSSFYYIHDINIWNHPHHNALPDASNLDNIPANQKVDYQQSIIGNTRKVRDGSTEISLGNTFEERSNIHPLLPFEGDFILEGRFGNSIRFGSTVKYSNISNEWSKGESKDGDPITIIRNGQPDYATNTGWVPILEEINGDKSSMYITSTQQIPIKVASTNQGSYKLKISNPKITTPPPSSPPSTNISPVDSDIIPSEIIENPVSVTTNVAPNPFSSSATLITEEELQNLFPGDDLSETVESSILEEIYFIPEATQNSSQTINTNTLAPDLTEPEKVNQEGFIKPTTGIITSRAETRQDPINPNKIKVHGGIDIANKVGTPVYAVARGIVKRANVSSTYGNVIIIYHPEHDLYSLYAHLNNILVTVGSGIGQGQKIGSIGTTGRSTGPHLHFEFIQTKEAFGTKEFYAKSNKKNPEAYINFS